MAATLTKDTSLTLLNREYWIYKPDGWSGAAVDTYACLVFYGGTGDRGLGIDNMIVLGGGKDTTPIRQAQEKMNTADFPWDNFVIIGIYQASGDPFVSQMRRVFDDLVTEKDSFKIRTDRIAFTGLSLGAIYISRFMQLEDTDSDSRDLYAAYPVSGGAGTRTAQGVADTIGRGTIIRGWLAENDAEFFATRMRDDLALFEANTPGYYLLQEFPGLSHENEVWDRVYNRQNANASTYNLYQALEDSVGGADVTPPTAPTSLASANIEKFQFDVTFTQGTDAGGIKQHNIYLDTVLVGVTIGSSFTLTNLIPNTEYTVEVEAEDTSGNKSTKASINITTLTDPVGVGVSSKLLESVL